MTTTFFQPSIATDTHNRRRSPMAWLATLLRPQVAPRPGQHTPSAGKTPDDAAHEAAAVRALAYRHLPTDPGFASDLFAAADRHQAVWEGASAAPAAQQR